MCDNEFKIENVFLTQETFFQMWYQMKPTSQSLSPLHTQPTYKQTRGVSHCSLAIYIKKVF
jgi:hypothetical protein